MNKHIIIKILVSLVASASAATLVAHADVQVAPFQPNTVLTAGALNAALQALKEGVNHPVVTKGAVAYSLGATTCGGTTPRYPNVGGWKKSKTMCEDACASPSAHVCTSEEVLRSLALSTSLPYSLGGDNRYRYAAANNVNGINNCGGWSADTGGFTNTVTSTAAGLSESTPVGCSEAIGIACCD